MDPLTIAVLAAAALAGSGVGVAAAIRSRRAARDRVAMRELVRRVIPIGSDPPVSLFDVFWDLGASDFALAMLAAAKLLPERPRELGRVVEALAARVAEHGSYRAFVREQLEAIQEFYAAHREAGDRRAVVTLALPAVRSVSSAGDRAPSTALRVASDAERASGRIANDRAAWRTGEVAPLLLHEGDSVDLDHALEVDVGKLVGSLFDGSITHEAKRWFARRDARQLRDALDDRFATLYAVYAAHVRSDPASIAHLFDASRRWEADATRIAALEQAPSFADKPWALCGTVLLQEARAMARTLAHQAATSVESTLARIDSLAAAGNTAMAGYLVYVNRYALFVGRAQLIDAIVGEVETALARLRAEFVGLARKGLF